MAEEEVETSEVAMVAVEEIETVVAETEDLGIRMTEVGEEETGTEMIETIVAEIEGLGIKMRELF